MADEMKPNGGEAQTTGEGAQGPRVSILGQYIKDLSFENPNAPKSFQEPGENPNLQLNFNVGANKISDDTYEVTLHFEGEAKSDTSGIYQLDLAYAGVFRVQNLAQERLRPFLFIDCPAMLFPFVRRLIADLTREGGYPPLLIDPIDFAALYRRNAAQQQAESETGASA
jgi:preprotein translocase subunit SecB